MAARALRSLLPRRAPLVPALFWGRGAPGRSGLPLAGATQTRSLAAAAAEGAPCKVVFVLPDGEEREVVAAMGQSLLDVAHKHHIEMEGACEGSVACSTCHVILEEDVFDELPEPSEEEDDMLDMAPGLTDTSRLGCQVILQPGMEGLRVTLPRITRNFYVDGHKPTPH